MSLLSNLLKKIASLKVQGILFILFVAAYFVINGKPFGLAQLIQNTGASIPDMEMFGYTPQRVFDVMTVQGMPGRAFYLHYIIPQDFPFPLLYGLLFASALTLLAQRLFPSDHPFQRIGLLGLCAGLADWCENLCLLGLLFLYPQRLDALAALASIFTVLKTTLALLSAGLIMLGLGWLGVRTITHKVSITNRTRSI